MPKATFKIIHRKFPIPRNHMKYFFLFFILIFITEVTYPQNGDILIQFDKPANSSVESLPIGNGRLGAMIFGNTKKERIALNEISLWSGGPQDADRDSAWRYLKPIQNLLLEGKNQQAQELLQKHFVAKGPGSGNGNGALDKYGCYQTMGDLFISWKDSVTPVTHYIRTLNIEKASALTRFIRKNITYTEEAFSDFVNDITWIKFSSSKKNRINISLTLYRKENVNIRADKNRLIMVGQLPSGKDKGMKFATVAKVVLRDGSLRKYGNQININNSTECWIKISSATNYDYAKGGLSDADVLKKALTCLAKTKSLSFSKARQKSTSAYLTEFNRCRWKMPVTNQLPTLTTNQRLIKYHEGKPDNQLPVLYLNFGRYLLISSSRPGLLPANLQGLWATQYQTPWNGDYHLNINLQMNYWPAEVTNLGSIGQPLFQFTSHLVFKGEKTAWDYYHAKGWVAHVISNPWFYTSPGESAEWGSTLTGGAWLCTQLWEHFRFTRDTGFLRIYYPVIKGAAQFLQSILIREPQHGWLVTAPSNSPENAYVMPDGFIGNTCMGPTMDMQICRDLFNACISASSTLNKDPEWRMGLQDTVKQLAPDQIGARGDLNEWLNDWKDADPHHRHISHLFGLYPYDEISVIKTPALAAAAKETLIQRGDAGTGWSMAWKINFWARLHDGEHAIRLFKELLNPVIENDETKSGGGTYPNLFCAHPPFQIDGNFGGTAGLAEMLLQSDDSSIVLLPALPKEWPSGNITGLCARGGFEVSMQWNDGKLISYSILSKAGRNCTIQYHGKSILLKTYKGEFYKSTIKDFEKET